MRAVISVAFLIIMSGTALAGDCYRQLQNGDTMEEVIASCGEPTHRRDLENDMEVRDRGAGQAKMLTIEHSRTETLWVYEGERTIYLRFVNGELVEKDARRTQPGQAD
ncbi:MAG: DUF2845 domain-containing protein [Desulfuromonadales bacterium]|nr:DUF2845 domain-containing protein [Desulfuromonadales bacterium]NIR33833.1 DUF2845 domain-containing protein [Desulfuromonadales bacterium]NIS39992.1 DUF2845 domain-containing protein [Desulfuromonadales bacterium]